MLGPRGEWCRDFCHVPAVSQLREVEVQRAQPVLLAAACSETSPLATLLHPGFSKKTIFLLLNPGFEKYNVFEKNTVF